MFGMPKSRDGTNQGVSPAVEPSGTCQTMREWRRSTLTRVPQGGAVHGRSQGESSGSRRMA